MSSVGKNKDETARAEQQTGSIRLATFDTLKNPSYRSLWMASWCVYIGRAIASTTIPWLVLDLTDSPYQVSLAGIAQTIPMFLLGFFAGGLADRYPKKHVMAGAAALSVSAAAALALAATWGALQPWHAFAYMFVLGATTTTMMPARQSYISDLFGGSRLANAVSLDSVTTTGSMMLGPVIAGALLDRVDYAGTFLTIVGFGVLGTVLFLLMKGEGSPARSGSGHQATATPDYRDAAKQIWANRAFRSVLLGTVVVNLFGYSYRNLVSVFARDVLIVGSTAYGLLGSATGLGSLIGSIAIASIRVRRHGTLFTLGSALLMASLLVFSLSPAYLLSFFCLLSVGIGSAVLGAMHYTIALESVAPNLRGRSTGAVSLAIGFTPIGMYALGLMTESIGPSFALAINTTMGLAILGLLTWKYPELLDRPS